MNNFYIESQKFYNQFRNGQNFSLNLTEYTDNITGNVGEIQKVVTELTTSTEVYASDFGSVTYTELTSQGQFEFSGSWFNEGISVGATIQIEWDGNTVEETVISSNGSLGNTLRTTKVNLGSLLDGARTDFVFKVKSAPNFLYYKYCLSPLTSSTNNYTSPFDANEQAYYAYLSGLTTLNTLGGAIESWNLGAVTAEFISTTVINGSYVHEYAFNHTFKIPYYIDGQLGNIDNLTPPNNLIGSNTYKYGFGVFMAENNSDVNRNFEYTGNSGSVGYFNENFNGFANNYEILNLEFSNGNQLEGTLSNTVTFQIKNNSIDFVTGDTIILTHSKLPSENEYSNKIDVFDDIWLFENIEIEIDAVATSGTIFDSAEVTLNADPTLLDVTIDIVYTTAQQLLIEEDKNYLLFATVGNPLLDPAIQDRVNLIIDQNNWDYDNDVYGLVQNNVIKFLNSNNEIGNSSYPTDFKGWDGDFVGCRFNFETKADENAFISNAVFRLMGYDGTEYFEINSTQIPVPNFQIVTVDSALVPYQICNTDVQNGYNITSAESFNRITLESTVPATSGTWQEWTGSLAFKVDWRSWIQNLNVPNVFYDSAEPNNNQNQKTSNYSNTNGYDIYAVIDLTISKAFYTSNVAGTKITLAGVDPNPTVYRLKSESSLILDFDDDGALGSLVTAETFYYDENNNLTENLFINENVRIEIEFTFTSLPAKVEGEIIIEPENTTQQEWRLSTAKDWTNNESPLKPTDTLLIGNTTLVEQTVSGNVITLICQTNRDNLNNGINYNVYGRLFAG